MLITHQFRTATCVLTTAKTVSIFTDGVVNEMYLDDWLYSDDYRWVAYWAGYGDDVIAYNRQHDLAHHWLADRMNWPWSHALHEAAISGNVPLKDASEIIKYEEHLVNRLQRWIMTGAPDEYRLLDAIVTDDDRRELLSIWSRTC